MIYNLAAVFNEATHQELLAFAEDFQRRNDCEFEYTSDSIPHATLIKYESESDPFTSLVQKEFEVTLSGLTLLPSRTGEDGGLWVEVSILIPLRLRLLINGLIETLDVGAIQSEVGDMLRPHLTVCKLRSWKNVKIGDLSPALLRKADVKIELHTGESGTGFSYDRVP